MIEMNYNAVNLRVYNILCFTAYGELPRLEQHELKSWSAVHRTSLSTHDTCIRADAFRRIPIFDWQSWVSAVYYTSMFNIAPRLHFSLDTYQQENGSQIIITRGKSVQLKCLYKCQP